MCSASCVTASPATSRCWSPFPTPTSSSCAPAYSAEADRVHLCDMAVAGRNPGRLLGSLFGAFLRTHADEGVRIVSEVVWPERTDEEYPACVEHEALVNVALADTSVHVLCPYDAARLPPFVI